MKQNTYNKGRNKNFTPKSKKFKSQPLKEDFDKKETRKAASEKVCALQSKKFHGNIKMSVW